MRGFLFGLLFVLPALTYAEIEVDDGVLVLTKDNFQSAIDDNEFILVEFYAPWCGHCKALAPEYAAAAKKLAEQGSAIKLGKVDATEQNDLAEQHNVRGYPTLKFFRKGTPSEFNGGRQADDIVAWLLKKTGPPAKDLTTVEAAKEFIESANVVIIGFFKDQDSDKAKVFLDTAASIDDHPFAITSNKDIFKEYEAECGNVILFKNFDEKKVVYSGESNVDSLKKFVQGNSLPLIVEFNHETAQKIFGGDIKSHLLLFLNKGEEHYDKITDAARAVAPEFREKVLFVAIDAREEDHKRILEFFGMKTEEVPTARLIKLEEDMAKYKPDTEDLSSENIKKFVNDFLEGKLTQHLLSEELPEDWDQKPVKTLVATNFDDVAFKKPTVLVEFYAPWCGHCKQLAPIYEKIGEHFKDNEDVVIAAMDATANELPHTKITSFPTIKLYINGDDNKVIDYNGPRTFEGLTKFVETKGVEEEGAEEEDDQQPKKDEL